MCILLTFFLLIVLLPLSENIIPYSKVVLITFLKFLLGYGITIILIIWRLSL